MMVEVGGERRERRDGIVVASFSLRHCRWSSEVQASITNERTLGLETLLDI